VVSDCRRVTENTFAVFLANMRFIPKQLRRTGGPKCGTKSFPSANGHHASSSGAPDQALVASSVDRWIRITTVAAVLIVAAVAGWISYRHCVAVVSSHGEASPVGLFYPAVVDGLIIAASMVLLDSARHRASPPRLALYLLGAGISATLAANVLAGVRYGPLGAVVSAWPALSFVGCYELLMLLVRSGAARTVNRPSEAAEALVQRAREAYLAGDYSAAAGHLADAETIAPGIDLRKAHRAIAGAVAASRNGDGHAE
jgi:Protein of unknown function (DUF2637)